MIYSRTTLDPDDEMVLDKTKSLRLVSVEHTITPIPDTEVVEEIENPFAVQWYVYILNEGASVTILLEFMSSSRTITVPNH